MLIPICKFVIFTLSPGLILIWSTSPDVLGKISSSVLSVSNSPSHFLHLVKDLPSRVHDLLISVEHLVKSLTCNDLEPSLLDLSPGPLHEEDSPSSAFLVEEPQPISQPHFALEAQVPSVPPGYLQGWL
ncbi:hypothetical protein DSO57_1011956 [Entomophthora muscae]|uniref:Uncharacterized protein n=1 Tax=Entomophthora muscae TaxID=34485 RepID=A0ACC2U4C1_9FUNG|nr:hypothetical protein DSO57_1011956 [Entomophthora muscae]